MTTKRWATQHFENRCAHRSKSDNEALRWLHGLVRLFAQRICPIIWSKSGDAEPGRNENAFVSQQLPLRSTATSRLYRPCRSTRSLHSNSNWLGKACRINSLTTDYTDIADKKYSEDRRGHRPPLQPRPLRLKLCRCPHSIAATLRLCLLCHSSHSLHLEFLRYPHANSFSACLPQDSPVERLPPNKLGKLFEQKYTRAKRQCGPIRLAPAKKRSKRGHHS